MSRTRRVKVLEAVTASSEIHIPCMCEIFYGDDKCRCKEVHKLMGSPVLTIKDIYGEDGKLKRYPDNEETEKLVQKLQNDKRGN